MNKIQRNPNERGSAILLVLGFLSLLLMMAMIFATTSRNAQIVADAKADEANAQLQARSAVTQGQEAVFFLQNKGNILGSTDSDLQDCLPINADIEQSPTELDTEADISAGKAGKELYYGTDDEMNANHLGLQPYIGITTDELPTSWRFLAFYGELSKDAFATTPFGITTTSPYQSLYYSHSTEDSHADFDEVDKQGENSLYEIVKATTLGNLYFEATGGAGGQFEALLKNDISKQLQFRNFFQEDPEDHLQHVFSRQGFIMFNEGSKFDVNRLVSLKMDGDPDEPYLPFVGGDGTDGDSLGAITLGDPGSSLNIDIAPGRSTYAIMGRKYDTGKYTSDELWTTVEENMTVQYGLHPAELQTRVIGGRTVYEDALDRQDTNRAPRWFNYEQLYDNDDVKDAIKEDIFTLGIESGVDDRELRFNGQYGSMPEVLQSIGNTSFNYVGAPETLDLPDGRLGGYTPAACSYLAKTNIAFPWGFYCETDGNTTCPEFGCEDPTWDDISLKLQTGLTTEDDLKGYAEHFFQKHLGLNYDSSSPANYLFKDDHDNDLTSQVFANMVDFCDSDNELTYWANFGTSKLTFDTASMAVAGLTANPTPIINEPKVCGNEKTPAVVGVKVDFDVSTSTTVGLSTDSRNGSIYIPFVGNVSLSGMCAMTVGGGNVDFVPTITLSLQNFFGEEELPNASRDYRIVVEGEIVPIILAKQSFISYDHGIKRSYRNVLLIGDTGSPIPVGSTGSNASTLTNYYLSSAEIKSNVTVDAAFSANARHFRIDKKMTTLSGSIPALQNILLREVADYVRFPITGRTFGTKNISLDGNHYFHVGSGYAVKISKIVVMGREDSCKLSELAYMENTDLDWIVNYHLQYADLASISNCNFSLPVQNTGNVATDGATCRDPRMNHKKDQWMWVTSTERPSSIVSVPYGSRILARNYDTTTFAKYSLETVEDALQNGNSVSKDWEPTFNPGNMTPTVPGGNTSNMATTISTFYIPNTPISSLWQLGAIHRGATGQTINLKKFGTDASGAISHKYEDGDAWILDYLKLNELNPNFGIRGKFNPNCFNAGAYRFLFANIPANADAKETMIYANGFYDPETEVQRSTFFRDLIGGTAPATYVNLEDNVFRFMEVGAGKDYTHVTDILSAQSWSPVQAFFNFVDVDGGTSSKRTSASSTYKCNDRQAEALVGCSAGLLSTRYEVFTAIAVGQSVKFIMTEAEMNAVGAEGSDERNAVMRQLASPIRICFMRDGHAVYEWYSILSTQIREVTFVRDCWFGKIKVLKSRLL